VDELVNTEAKSEDQRKELPTEPRRLYLETLLERMRSSTKVMRHYLGEQDQNTTLGLAAEMGVRDVLRNILPGRFGVTSGFMCQPDGSLVKAPENEQVSPQTDVIIYDASRACPLYRMMNDIEVVATHDVLGIVEVKDRAKGELALGRVSNTDPGALAHVAHLAEHARGAFRAIVLLRGSKLEEKPNHRSAYEQCEKAKLTGASAPHVIYCADKNYVGVYEYISNRLHFVQYGPQDGALALADFLRVVASFQAAQGLSTTSISLGLGLRPFGSSQSNIPLSLQLKDRTPLPSLREVIANYPVSPSKSDEATSFEGKLKQFVQLGERDGNLKLYCVPTTGRDERGSFTSGIAIVARWEENAETKAAASFFAMTPQGSLRCVEPESAAPQDWIIAHERPEAYLQRVCNHIAESYDPFAGPARFAGLTRKERG
jgi:hypothetical protein